MIRIGLDLSINSTGVCICEDSKEPIYYFIIPDKLSKKQKAASQHKRINFITYDKIKGNDDHNINHITSKIMEIIKGKCDLTKSQCCDSATLLNDDIKVVIEDVALAAKGSSIITLTLLNGWMRCLLTQNGIDYITVPPTQWKKVMIGNGSADKELIVYCWSAIDNSACVALMNNGIVAKHIDIADAYFLAKYTK